MCRYSTRHDAMQLTRYDIPCFRVCCTCIVFVVFSHLDLFVSRINLEVLEESIVGLNPFYLSSNCVVVSC